ncbi:MAG: DUF2344 domain-containing protein [Clostridia bacterium]|nr:DUF2344 domain-containing protein [Clostridia bacterium]
MKILVKFSRSGALCMISHLDLLRTVQRSLRRAELPILYSQGFNPHPILSFAQAMGVGLETEGDYFAVGMEDTFDPAQFCERFNACAPSDLMAIAARKMANKERDPMARVQAARYRLVSDNEQALVQAAKALFKKTEYPYTRKTKSGERESDMRPMLLGLNTENGVRITVTCGDTNLPPAVLAAALAHVGGFPAENISFVREDLLTMINGELESVLCPPLEMD